MWSSALIISSLLLTQLDCKQLITKDLEYEPKWDSLDNRPLPQWYDDAKIGIFIHWGVFSVPAFGSEWFWNSWKGKNKAYINYMKRNYPPNFTYQDFGPMFTAELFDPDQWADLFAASGAKYVVLTSKHHEGYCLWPSKYSYSWNSMDVGPQRDIVGDLASSIKIRTNLKFGLYHSLYEWFNPLWLNDKSNNFSTNDFVVHKTLPELYELVENYSPEVIWSDGEWEAPDTYWQSKEFLAWLFNSSPVKDTVVVNDRWGHETLCHHGDFYTCTDRFNPGVLQKHKWENAMTIDKKSWGYRRNANIADYMTMSQLLNETISTVSCGGNILINVGPTKEGMIAPIYQERLIDLGKWLAINGDAIFNTRPWKIQNDTITPGVWYTQKLESNLSIVFVSFLNWPVSDQTLVIGNDNELFRDGTEVRFLNQEELILSWTVEDKAVVIKLPPKHLVKSDWCWVVKILTPKSNNV